MDQNRSFERSTKMNQSQKYKNQNLSIHLETLVTFFNPTIFKDI